MLVMRSGRALAPRVLRPARVLRPLLSPSTHEGGNSKNYRSRSIACHPFCFGRASAARAPERAGPSGSRYGATSRPACFYLPKCCSGWTDMPLRFTRRLSLIPGLRVNLSKGGASLSVGHRGASRPNSARPGRLSRSRLTGALVSKPGVRRIGGTRAGALLEAMRDHPTACVQWAKEPGVTRARSMRLAGDPGFLLLTNIAPKIRAASGAR